jgi:hypothetical protein
MRLLSCVIAAALAATAAQAAPYKAPRTPYGTPDLQGIWTNTALTFLERPPIFKALVGTPQDEAMMIGMFKKMAGGLLDPKVDPNMPAPPVVKSAPQADIIEMDLHLARINGEIRTSWIVEPADGKVPYNDAGKAALKVADKESFDGPEMRPLTERCLTAVGSPEGPPMMNTGFNANYQIVQTPDYVAIFIEMNHDVRIIRLKDRAHPPADVRPWLGDSVGWWDGDTLVVETTNLNLKSHVTSLSGDVVFSPQAKVTERFTRTGPNAILYQFAVDDPAYLKTSWKAEMPMRTAPGPIYEYACHEGNYGVANALSGARYEEKQAAIAAAEEAKAAAAKAAQPAPAPPPAKPGAAAKPAKTATR